MLYNSVSTGTKVTNRAFITNCCFLSIRNIVWKMNCDFNQSLLLLFFKGQGRAVHVSELKSGSLCHVGRLNHVEIEPGLV